MPPRKKPAPKPAPAKKLSTKQSATRANPQPKASGKRGTKANQQKVSNSATAKTSSARPSARTQASTSHTNAATATSSTDPSTATPHPDTNTGGPSSIAPPAVPPTTAKPSDPSTSASNRSSKKRPAPSKAAQSNKAPRVASGTGVRRTAVRPEYDEIWKEVYLAGTEWDQLKDVYSIDWDFDHLDEALTDGDMAEKKVHLFGCTEPQLIRIDEKDDKGHVVPVPVIVAVVCDVAPPSTVGIKSVQRATEEIVPMAKLRMSWEAYSPPNVALRPSFKPLVHVLKCTQRKARLRNMGEEDVHRYDYVLPYFIDPSKSEDVEENTVVQVLADLEGIQAPLMCEFDYEMDELSEFVETTLQEQELDEEKHTETLKTAIREAVRATKLKHKKDRLDRQRMIDAIPQEEKDAFKAMEVIKFYPANEWPDVSAVKSRFVNRYYGQAHRVV